MDEECSSNESGWTTYIASSPDQEEDDDDDDRADVEADVDADDDVDSIEKGCKKEYVEDGDSDDSMASDASSGPTTDQGKSCFAYGKSRVFSHADERKCVGKKKGKDEQMKKVGKEKTGNRGNSAGRSKKV